MADDGKQPLRWVSGPNTRADGSWQVTVADMAGKPQTRTFKVEARAQEYADGANERKSISPIGTEDGNDPLIIDIPDHDETGQDIGWYQTAGRVVLKAMLTCADPVRREILRKDLAAISSVQKGVKAIVDQGKLEKRIAEVEGQLGEVRAKRRYGAGTRGTFRSNRARAGSSE